MCVYIYVYMYTHMCTHIMYIYIYMCAHTHMFVYVCIYTYMGPETTNGLLELYIGSALRLQSQASQALEFKLWGRVSWHRYGIEELRFARQPKMF